MQFQETFCYNQFLTKFVIHLNQHTKLLHTEQKLTRSASNSIKWFRIIITKFPVYIVSS